MQLSKRVIKPDSSDSNELMNNLLSKKQLLEAGNQDHESIRAALVVYGGGMRATYAAGVVTALDQLGLRDIFDDVIGISAGSGTAAYLLSGQAESAVSIYEENFAQKEFTNPLRRKSIVNVPYLEDVFTKLKPLNQIALRESRSTLHVGVTNSLTAQGEYLAVNHDENQDIVRAIQASASLPGISAPIKIGDKLYVDGVVGCKTPIDYVIRELGATDVLAVINEPLETRQTTSPLERIVIRGVMRRYPAAFRQAYLERYIGSDQNAEANHPESVRVGVLCPESMPLSRMSHDVSLVSKVARAAVEQTLNAFDI